MKVTSLEARSYRFPLDPPFSAAWDPVPRTFLPETIVVVHTDEGVRGCCGGAPAPDLALLERFLVGIDPTDTERVFRICETVDFHGGRNWTVEVACWDIAGKVSGLPLWRLLGGRSGRYRAYASCGERLPAGQRAERLLAWRERGIGAAKIRFDASDWRDDLRVVENCRAAVGADFDLLVDANQGWRMPGDLRDRWDLATATECARSLADAGVFWLEEPLDTAAVEDYRRLREKTGIRIAAGEMVRTLSESRRLLSAVDVIQNDVVLAGGVTGCRRVASWAEEVDAAWSPHTWSTGYGLLVNLHVALAYSRCPYLEVPYDPPAWSVDRRDFMLPAPIEIDGEGYVAAPAGPGLGCEPDLEALEQWRVG
ncbi:MAG TPA: mandelate racemase/muconate lactonizing enzyme family protein [Acidimicrobiia bacterium]|nr:mandelate racemase/muconate lactonizing enzyme family protein [Acidimicrobiia bacterium]